MQRKPALTLKEFHRLHGEPDQQVVKKPVRSVSIITPEEEGMSIEEWKAHRNKIRKMEQELRAIRREMREQGYKI